MAFLNLTFARRDCSIGDTNVKFTPRVVRFRHLAPVAACPRPNVGIARTTRNDKVLVAFLNVTFVRRDCGIGDTNVKFTPRVVRFRHLAPIARCPQPNVGIARTTRNDKFLVAFLNVTFVRRDCGIGDTNVTFTPRAVTSVPPAAIEKIALFSMNTSCKKVAAAPIFKA
jgi:predicted small integral membrane protein